MAREIDLVIVSSRLENKRTLLRFLEGLPLNIYPVGNVEEAEETFEEHEIDVVVCDERVSDGTYHDVLALMIDRILNISIYFSALVDGEYKRYDWSYGCRPPPHATDIDWHYSRAAPKTVVVRGSGKV